MLHLHKLVCKIISCEHHGKLVFSKMNWTAAIKIHLLLIAQLDSDNNMDDTFKSEVLIIGTNYCMLIQSLTESSQ